MNKISAFMDGETSPIETRQAVQNLKKDDHCCESWETFHLIGDVMRGDSTLRGDFAARLHARMEQEPTLLAPRMTLRNSTQFALSAAASLAAVAIILTLVFSDNPLKPQAQIAAAPASISASIPVSVPNSESIQTAQAAGQPQPVTAVNQARVNEYLMAHQEYSPIPRYRGWHRILERFLQPKAAALDRIVYMRVALPAFLILLSGVGCAMAEGAAPPDAMTWLKKIATASRQLNYRGTFVYQHGNQVETSRISHFVDTSGEYEKLETLDGPPREVIRNNDNVACYLPDSKTVVIEKRAARRFPALLPEQISGITDNYVVRTGEQGRVAGYDCQIVVLEPRDNLRYGHKFCAELMTGMPLRARMFNDKNEMVESFAFTQLAIGAGISKDMIKSRYAGISQGWRIDKSALDQKETSADTGWVLKNQPAGFKKLTEMKRMIAGRATPVSHIVYSDGLAAISVFIEPMPKSPPPSGPTYQGAVNIYVKSRADQMVTVVGETPARTVKQIAESLSSKDQ